MTNIIAAGARTERRIRHDKHQRVLGREQVHWKAVLRERAQHQRPAGGGVHQQDLLRGREGRSGAPLRLQRDPRNRVLQRGHVHFWKLRMSGGLRRPVLRGLGHRIPGRRLGLVPGLRGLRPHEHSTGDFSGERGWPDLLRGPRWRESGTAGYR